MWRDPEKCKNWTIQDSEELYGINKWGADYFQINPIGDVTVTPFGKGNNARISLYDIVQEIEERGMSMPVILRIENILGSQIKLLHETFRKVIEDTGYQGQYKGVFPIKVNQQEQVIEAIAEFGRKYNHGLEAGSKPELIAAISMLQNRDACLICNGYKDEEFIDLGLNAVKMGYQCFFVIEVPGEVDLILERAKKLKVRPLLGLRGKLSTQAEGQWSESGGDNSVFGLNVSQMVDVLDRLKEENKLDCLKLLHYHIGSQIPNIRDIRAGALEACRIYEELVNEGAPMGYIDFGGGLAVDYDGSNTNYHSSRNYSVEEYCYDVVESIMNVLGKKGITHPTIITESGRVTVAYYSVLLFNILDVSSFIPHPIPDELPKCSNDLLDNLLATYKDVAPRSIQESCNDALFYRNQARQLFKHGQITLRQRAMAENLVRHILMKISSTARHMTHVPKDVQDIDKLLYDIYYGNFSLFQSLPDVWAINQIFPVMPIHRLNEAPTRPAIISDITCDCDGKIDNFPDYSHDKNAILLHDLKESEEYYLGVFLVGAYQETLGDLHNLFGDTNVVSINVHLDGSYEVVRELEGDSVSDVLSYVEYDVKAMKHRLKKIAEDAVQKGFITGKERKDILNGFEEGLRGYTYFEKD
ncbi:biosynthetic arginine decarboxylase [Seleniivibrio woodruffii]|uniref:Arginine decarboxylase n=1 Tax=Seleniivibrio woodruffii TaxID=1078050 RepID=A0A4R1KD84_9BACT|nr:biosynthetic arginine decarboxylase [Seleniivibrio woodruffii]TCK62020.1 arginine decarboxylase [Seleniivibrio woodruffii]TVZ34863.1 arginine decarboxylase [Seleniivibrio woodruffii]